MDNKVLVQIYVPELDIKYDLFLPINKKIGNVIINLVKAINELTENAYPLKFNHSLINSETCLFYDENITIKESDILNGTKLILM